MEQKNLDSHSFGFYENNKKKDYNKMEKNILKSVEGIFSPELLNRLDEIIVFNSLKKTDIYEIIDLQLIDLIKNLSELDIKIIVYKSAKNLILKKGYNVEYGVRFLRRAIQTMIENPISEILLKNDLLKGETFIVKSINNKIKISVKSQLPIIT